LLQVVEDNMLKCGGLLAGYTTVLLLVELTLTQLIFCFCAFRNYVISDVWTDIYFDSKAFSLLSALWGALSEKNEEFIISGKPVSL